jgi:hypothetical protein
MSKMALYDPFLLSFINGFKRLEVEDYGRES